MSLHQVLATMYNVPKNQVSRATSPYLPAICMVKPSIDQKLDCKTTI